MAVFSPAIVSITFMMAITIFTWSVDRSVSDDLVLRSNGLIHPCVVSFAKSLCPKLKGVLPVWRELFGLGWQAESSTDERCSLRRHEPSSAELRVTDQLDRFLG